VSLLRGSPFFSANTSCDEPEDRSALLQSIGLGRLGETADGWLRNTSQDLDRPLTQIQEGGFSYCDQFVPFSHEDLLALDRAAAKRQREDDIAFLNKWGLSETFLDETMVTASDAAMGVGAGESQQIAPNKRARGVEEEEERQPSFGHNRRGGPFQTDYA